MKCQIVVRTTEAFFHWEADLWLALQLVSCAAAEPKTREQLDLAMRHYRPQHRLWEHAKQLSAEPLPDPGSIGTADGWCLVDYVGRTVVFSQTFPEVVTQGTVYKWEEQCSSGSSDWYTISPQSPPMARLAILHLPKSWVAIWERRGWQRTVTSRYQEALAEPLIDIDTILWGAPLWEQIAAAVKNANAPNRRTTDRKIHVSWLCTASPDLMGYAPRRALMAGADYADYELELRQYSWIITGCQPAPLTDRCYAYRYGPYCETHHILHFLLFRTLLEEAWRCREQAPSAPVDSWCAQLEKRAEAWWNTPYPDSLTGLTHREIWHQLRRRVPLTVPVKLLPGFLNSPFSCSKDNKRLAFECFGWAGISDQFQRDFTASGYDERWFPWQMHPDAQSNQDGELTEGSRTLPSAGHGSGPPSERPARSCKPPWRVVRLQFPLIISYNVQRPTAHYLTPAKMELKT